jgi:hypothetical protein
VRWGRKETRDGESVSALVKVGGDGILREVIGFESDDDEGVRGDGVSCCETCCRRDEVPETGEELMLCCSCSHGSFDGEGCAGISGVVALNWVVDKA